MEIKALLVDDEEQCVKTLQDGIDWKVLGVAETFGAYNAVQAQNKVSNNGVHSYFPIAIR